jgi:hypothetical protein
MNDVRLTATLKRNGYQATSPFPTASRSTRRKPFPSIPEAIRAAALKLMDMHDRIEALGDEAGKPSIGPPENLLAD